jgi:Txe/YoeB family toxin of toxin-antitoxin system
MFRVAHGKIAIAYVGVHSSEKVMTMTILNATEARSRLYSLTDEAASAHQPIILTGKRGSRIRRRLEFNCGNSPSSVRARHEGIDQERIESTTFGARRGIGLVKWILVYTKQAQKDTKKLASSRLKKKAKELLKILEQNFFQNPPPYEKLIGNLAGAYSRRINIQHRTVYQLYEKEKTIKIIRLWTHCE